ncbi:alpha/beta hydrolase [Sphingobium algorifonticola]|nr:alpha/beta hydrolase [Sphingobium algorifonticola]
MKRLSQCLVPLLLLVLSGCAASLPPPDPAQWVRDCRASPIPMPTTDDGGGPLLFATTRLPDCRAGSFTMSVERSDVMRLGWYEADAAVKPGDPVTPNLANEEDWWTTLAAQLARGQGRVLLFVHGYNNNFASPAVRLRMMRAAGEFRGPAILFAWPSQDAVLKYPWDETNVDWTQAYLNVMIRRLARDPAVNEIVLVGHSMGSRSVIDAMEVLDAAGLAKVRTVILASPDVDRDRFSQIIQGIPGRAGVVSGERHYTVYLSAKDSAIGISRRIHHYPRLGSPFCFGKDKFARCYPKPSPVLDVVDTSWVSKSDLGHNDFLDSPQAAEDLKQALQGKSGPLPGRLPAVSGIDDDPVGDGIWRLCPTEGCARTKGKKAKVTTSG